MEKLAGQPAMPELRGLQAGAGGGWSVEEFVASDRLPLAAYLTQSAAPVWVFVSIVQRCLRGLIGLHERGFYHGALSPRTVLVDPAGNVILAGCGAAEQPLAWNDAESGFKEAPPLRHALAAADLRDLGRVFRAVLGGDADTRITVSRPDIAPPVAEWIDWLADPPQGREPLSASQAETVFADIRTGRAAWRPWRSDSELPPEIGSADERSSGQTEEERARLARAARLAHGSELEWRPILIFGLIVVGLLAGGAWMLNNFLSNQAKGKAAQEQASLLGPGAVAAPLLPDDDFGIYEATGEDTEPVTDTAEAMAKLSEAIRKKFGLYPDWQKRLQLQRGEKSVPAEEESPEDGADWLIESHIFPPIGKASAGRSPGDYYLVWRTQNMILTMEECRILQSAILRGARYCGVRVMAWTVLPNQAGVVLRLPLPHHLTDERLERRIAILRDERTASKAMAKVNAKLKAGDQEGAEMERRVWTASMGSVAGFYGVVKTVPILPPDVLKKLPLWQRTPLRLSLLDPDTPDVLRAAGIVDLAAVKGGLAGKPSDWPLCGLTAAMLNYGPALRAISVLMQDNPQSSLPVPAKVELQESLHSYRLFLGDLPPEPPEPLPPPVIRPPHNTLPLPPDAIARPVSSAKN